MENDLKVYGSLISYASEKCHYKIHSKKWLKKMNLERDVLNQILDGVWKDENDYIRLLSICLKGLLPRKVKLKHLPTGFPDRGKIENLIEGNCFSISEYKDIILKLGVMPDIPPQKRPTLNGKGLSYIGYLHTRHGSHRDSKGYYSNPYTQSEHPKQSNNDFEYGITDT